MAVPLKVAVFSGSELVEEHDFERDIIKIGRLASAHLKLDDPKVSRIHAVIEIGGDGQTYSVIDMGSSDGTFVNGERISKHELKSGDELTIGDFKLQITMAGAEQAEAPAAVAAAASVPPQAEGDYAGQPAWDQQPAPDMAQDTQVMAEPMAPHAMQEDLQQAVAVEAAMQQQQWTTQAEAAAWGQQQPQAGWQGQDPGYQQPQEMYAQQDQYAQDQYAQQQPQDYAYQGYPADQGAYDGQYDPNAQQWGPWGTVPNNLAAQDVPETDRALEIKVVWHNSVLDTITATDQQTVTMGDEPQTEGLGPFKKFKRCDIDVPSKGLPERSFPIAVSQSAQGATYGINIHDSFSGYIERADGTAMTLEDLRASGRGLERGMVAATSMYNLNNEETLYLNHGLLTLQVRYVRKTRFFAPPWMENLNYTWVNILILAFFLHILAVSVFVAMPRTTEELTEALYKNPNRFAQFLLKPEEKQKTQSNMLAKLKAGPEGAKARGKEGKAGRKDYDKNKKQGRMAVKGDPNEEEIAKSALNKLFGVKGTSGRSYLFGSGGLGGELKGALGGVTGAEIGDAWGLGGLGTRGTGPGGGGLSMNSVGLGALGTHGRGGGGSGYGTGIGRLGKKVDRDINISAGTPIIMGSLDKELIRRVINQHKAQIRYCYEKELVRQPGLFGKVAVVWTITAEGSVSDSSVKSTTMDNQEVGRCITQKIRTWKFPKPKGGGIVIVNYPFVFKTSG